jgi:hypothetical protein
MEAANPLAYAMNVCEKRMQCGDEEYRDGNTENCNKGSIRVP